MIRKAVRLFHSIAFSQHENDLFIVLGVRYTLPTRRAVFLPKIPVQLHLNRRTYVANNVGRLNNNKVKI